MTDLFIDEEKKFLLRTLLLSEFTLQDEEEMAIECMIKICKSQTHDPSN